MGLPFYIIQAHSFLLLSHHFFPVSDLISYSPISLLPHFPKGSLLPMYSWPLLWTKLKQNITLLHIFPLLFSLFVIAHLRAFFSAGDLHPLTEIVLWPHSSRCWPSVLKASWESLSGHVVPNLSTSSPNPLPHPNTLSFHGHSAVLWDFKWGQFGEWVWHVCGRMLY